MNLNYSHLPSWLERNWVFRKLFLLRKMYLIKARSSHYGQFAEDVSIARFFDSSYRGFFVDVGCFHPKKYSNTWRLHKQGWRGINIDIDSIKINGFDMVRPGDINIACAVSNTEGEVTCYSHGFYAGTTSLHRRCVSYQPDGVPRTVRSATLTSLINATRYKNRQVDFLSVDAEHHDLEVLRSLDFDRYDPKLIAVESHLALLSEVTRSPLYEFLAAKQYDLVGWCGLTLLMANPTLQKTLAKKDAA